MYVVDGVATIFRLRNRADNMASRQGCVPCGVGVSKSPTLSHGSLKLEAQGGGEDLLSLGLKPSRWRLPIHKLQEMPSKDGVFGQDLHWCCTLPIDVYRGPWSPLLSASFGG